MRSARSVSPILQRKSINGYSPLKQSNNAVSSNKGPVDKDKVKILIRIRPFLNIESQEEFITTENENMILVHKQANPHIMKFNHVFSYNSHQDDIYSQVKENINNFLSGNNQTIFAYGQTGAGKTYTILGDQHNITNQNQPVSESFTSDQRGILPRALYEVWDNLQERKQESYRLFISFYEVYNEKIYDLFNMKDYKEYIPLDVREMKNGDVNIPDLITIQIESLEQAFGILALGLKRRAIGSTMANAQSSRSHSIFQIQLHSIYNGQIVSESLMRIVDLAGSEKCKIPVDISQEERELRIQELTSINGSLSTLGQCITALTDKKRTHIPFRNSKLTRVLSDSLSGNSRITFIVCVSPSISSSQETISTLQFATRAKKAILDGRYTKIYQQKNELNLQDDIQKIMQEYNKEKYLRLQLEEMLYKNPEKADIQVELAKLRQTVQSQNEKIEFLEKQLAQYQGSNSTYQYQSNNNNFNINSTNFNSNFAGNNNNNQITNQHSHATSSHNLDFDGISSITCSKNQQLVTRTNNSVTSFQELSLKNQQQQLFNQNQQPSHSQQNNQPQLKKHFSQNIHSPMKSVKNSQIQNQSQNKRSLSNLRNSNISSKSQQVSSNQYQNQKLKRSDYQQQQSQIKLSQNQNQNKEEFFNFQTEQQVSSPNFNSKNETRFSYNSKSPIRNSSSQQLSKKQSQFQQSVDENNNYSTYHMSQNNSKNNLENNMVQVQQQVSSPTRFFQEHQQQLSDQLFQNNQKQINNNQQSNSNKYENYNQLNDSSKQFDEDQFTERVKQELGLNMESQYNNFKKQQDEIDNSIQQNLKNFWKVEEIFQQNPEKFQNTETEEIHKKFQEFLNNSAQKTAAFQNLSQLTFKNTNSPGHQNLQKQGNKKDYSQTQGSFNNSPNQKQKPQNNKSSEKQSPQINNISLNNNNNQKSNNINNFSQNQVSQIKSQNITSNNSKDYITIGKSLEKVQNESKDYNDPNDVINKNQIQSKKNISNKQNSQKNTNNQSQNSQITEENQSPSNSRKIVQQTFSGIQEFLYKQYGVNIGADGSTVSNNSVNQNSNQNNQQNSEKNGQVQKKQNNKNPESSFSQFINLEKQVADGNYSLIYNQMQKNNQNENKQNSISNNLFSKKQDLSNQQQKIQQQQQNLKSIQNNQAFKNEHNQDISEISSYTKNYFDKNNSQINDSNNNNNFYNNNNGKANKNSNNLMNSMDLENGQINGQGYYQTEDISLISIREDLEILKKENGIINDIQPVQKKSSKQQSPNKSKNDQFKYYNPPSLSKELFNLGNIKSDSIKNDLKEEMSNALAQLMKFQEEDSLIKMNN